MRRIDEAHRTARRRQILDGARRCFARNGFEGATISRLEEEIGLSRGAIFHYFEDKDAIFSALAKGDAERFTQIWAEAGYEVLLSAIAEESPEWLAVYFEVLRRARTDDTFARRLAASDGELADRFRSVLRQRQREGVYRTDVPLEHLATFLNVFANGLALRRAAGDPLPPVDTLVALLQTGLGGPGSARQTDA